MNELKNVSTSARQHVSTLINMKSSYLLLFIPLVVMLLSCQSMTYGPPRVSTPHNLHQGHRAQGDFETFGEEKDPIGTWIFAGVAAAAAISAGILVPLYVSKKL